MGDDGGTSTVPRTKKKWCGSEVVEVGVQVGVGALGGWLGLLVSGTEFNWR